MMNPSPLFGLFIILILHPCTSEDDVTGTPSLKELNDPNAMIIQEEEKMAELAQTAQSGINVSEDLDLEMEALLPSESGEKAPGDANVPVMSQGSDSTGLTDIRTSSDQLQSLESTERVHTGLNEVKEISALSPVPDLDEASSERDLTEIEHDTTDLETWRIGAISVVASLSLGVVIAVYCLKFRKRKPRQEIPVKNNEDSEAGETIHGESNENTVTAGDNRIIHCQLENRLAFQCQLPCGRGVKLVPWRAKRLQVFILTETSSRNVSNGCLDLTTAQQEASQSGISLDLPTKAVSSQDPS